MPIVLNGTTGITTPTYGGAVGAEYSVPVTGFKNRIINGDMRIDQRNAGASVTNITGSTYTLDRLKCYGSAASKFTVQQNAGSVTPPAGFTKYAGVTSSSAYSVGSTEEFEIYQSIEGLNISDLGWGTASASAVTLSFWVRSSLTGTFGGWIGNSAGNRTYPYLYTISAANTWEQKTITIAGDTSGTWLTTNGLGMNVVFSLGCGSTLLGTAGAWTSSVVSGATGQTNMVSTSGATFYITGVQLEKGSTATSFDVRDYGRELAMCQRYCYAANPLSNSALVASGWGYSTTKAVVGVVPPVPMRSNPTLTRNGLSLWSANAGADLAVTNITTASVTYPNLSLVYLEVTVASGLTVGQGTFLQGTSSPAGSGYLILSAEL